MIIQQIDPEVIETTDEIVVAQVVREISCGESCLDSIRKRAQVPDGKVFVSIDGGERTEVSARNPIPIDLADRISILTHALDPVGILDQLHLVYGFVQCYQAYIQLV